MSENKVLSVRTGILLLLLLAVGGFYLFNEQYGSRISQHQQRLIQEQRDLESAATVTEFRELFIPIGGNEHVTPAFHRDEPWHRSELARHRESIAGKTYDLIVLPMQESVQQTDRVTRLMSARWMARELSKLTDQSVMSPELALRLLGGRATRFENEDVKALAKRAGAKVVHSYLSASFHIKKGTKPIAVVVADADGNIEKRLVFQVPWPDRNEPFELAMSRVAPDIAARLLGLPQPSEEFERAENTEKEPVYTLPDTLTSLPARASSPLDHAIYLQFVGLLTPKMLDYERRRLFERSLLALREAGPASRHYNVLTARALFHLYRRPTALRYLETVSTPAEQALKEYLNGNYPELKTATSRIENPYLRIMAFIEMRDLHYAYNKTDGSGQTAAMESAQMSRLVSDGVGAASRKRDNNLPLPDSDSAPWAALITASAHDMDVWYAPNNVAFFQQLKGLNPEFDRVFEGVVGEQAASGELKPYGDVSTVLAAVFDRARRVPDSSTCCPGYDGKVQTEDLWNLYRNLSVANLYRKMNRKVNVQGSYTSAVEYAERLEPLFMGHPTFMRLYAHALYGKASSYKGAKSAYLAQQAYDLAYGVGIHSLSTDKDTIIARRLQNRLTSEFRDHIRRKEKEPFHVSLGNRPSSELNNAYNGFASALPYTNDKFECLKAAFKTKNTDDSALEMELANRFNGHPNKIAFQATRLEKKKQPNEAIALLHKAIAAGDEEWDTYALLGALLIDNSDYVGARDAFLEYPLFSSLPKDQRVRISNRAYDAGSALFWRGRHVEAKSLYEISASLDTGAESQYSGAERVAILEGDYLNALTFAHYRVQSYGSHYGFRDYFTFMHLYGYHELAENGFRAVAPRFDNPHVWASKFVGDRMLGKSLPEMSAWTREYLGMVGSKQFNPQGIRYLLMQATIDRAPDSSVLGSLRITENNKAKPHPGVKTMLSSIFPETYLLAGKSGSQCSTGGSNCLAEAQQASPYAHELFAGMMDGYVHLKAGRYDEAISAFLLYDRHRPLVTERSIDMTVPYLAMAAYKGTGSMEFPKLLALLDDHETGDRFDAELTKAIIYAKSNNFDASLQALNNALNKRPGSDWRPFDSWYQLIDTTEWLYKETGDKRFIKQAVEWVKRYQIIQPHFAWAYAFEAKYSGIEKDRIRAAGFATYLDPHSSWLSGVPERIRDLGTEWWESHNPFRITDEEIGTLKEAV